uniref:Acyltransferase n=1 Tax=Steinernema glaseri TaxID=37863 RepID=A0A1I8A8I6_9BILA
MAAKPSSLVRKTLETFAVATFVFMWLILPIMCSWLPIYLLFTPLAPLVLIYGLWFAYDFQQPARGSRPIQWIRRLKLWKYFVDYFPMKLVKTADLDPKRNYILGSHPHGVFCCGVFGNICTEASGISEKFPGLTPYVLTLNGQFYFPLRREFGMAMGGVQSSRKSLRYLLNDPEKKGGKLVTIVLGGAEEVLDAHSGHFDLKLASRKGFCRFALKFGADLVPMFHFGENDAYVQSHNPQGCALRSLQVWIKDKLGICPPLITGDSIFALGKGVLPRRRPITSVVGAPILVEKTEGDPTQEQIDELHAKYCDSLRSLFDEHKAKYGVPSDVCLNIY